MNGPHPITLVIAGRQNKRALLDGVRMSKADYASVITPADLSRAGWIHDPHAPTDDTLVIDGTVLSTRCLHAVLPALDYVQPYDLPHVHPADQLFVGQEMTAFLRSWLSGLPCQVIDPPTPTGLSGRAGDPAVWALAAATQGIPDRRWAAWPRLRQRRVWVVADRVIPPAPEPISVPALALTRAAHVSAAQLTFVVDGGTAVLVDAAPWWSQPSPDVLSALLAPGPVTDHPAGTASSRTTEPIAR